MRSWGGGGCVSFTSSGKVLLTLTLALAVAPTYPSSNLRAATMMASSPVICIATIEATRRVGKQSVRPARLASTIGVASTWFGLGLG